MILPPLIEPDTLEQNLDNPDLLIVDLCQDSVYSTRHIPNAIHVSPSELICGISPAAGRLPGIEQLQQVFNRIGLTSDKHVVAYDDEGGGWAGRFIWTLEVIGHHRWSYLNGGLIAWQNEGHPVSNAIPAVSPTKNSYTVDISPIAEIADIIPKLGAENFVIWDARSPDEFSGKRMLAKRGGHIPGAINCEWTDLMDRSRNLRIREDAEQFLASKGITPEKTTITHCLSHHRSGFTYLVAKILGFKSIKGYHGSWSEWGNNPDTPVEY